MIRYFSTKSGNTAKFVAALDLPAERIATPPDGRFVLVTPTYGAGECPGPVMRFMAEHHKQCFGAIVGGNRNFGLDFAGAATHLKQKYGTLILWRFELAGTAHDVETCRKGILQCLK